MSKKYIIGIDFVIDEIFDNDRYITLLLAGYLIKIAVFLSIILLIMTIKQKEYLSLLIYVWSIPFFCYVLKTEEINKAKDFHKRLKSVPENIKENAKINYGRQWKSVAIECYESHVAGDCPLCGAI